MLGTAIRAEVSMTYESCPFEPGFCFPRRRVFFQLFQSLVPGILSGQAFLPYWLRWVLFY